MERVDLITSIHSRVFLDRTLPTVDALDPRQDVHTRRNSSFNECSCDSSTLPPTAIAENYDFFSHEANFFRRGTSSRLKQDYKQM